MTMLERLPPEADKDLVREWCDRGAIESVLVGGADTNGIFRAKRLSVERFLSVLSTGLPISVEIFALDPAGEFVRPQEPRRSSLLPTADSGFPDVRAIPDPTTLRVAPWDDHLAVALVSFAESGVQLRIDPRGVLVRCVDALRERGYQPVAGFEFEFYLLAESEATLSERGFTRLTPVMEGSRTFQVSTQLAMDALAGAEIRERLVRSGSNLWADHVEEGPGQLEITVAPAPILQAADAALIHRVAVHEIARQQGYMATFMSKPHESWAGSSGHIHMSLEQKGSPGYQSSEGQLSAPLRWFIGGTLATLSDCSAFQAPTVNSYKRLQPGSWAGTTRTWGFDNRTVSVRVPYGDVSDCRVELRRPGSDVNPYLAAASAVAAGTFGIAKEIEPPPPTYGNAEEGAAMDLMLPGSLEEALEILERSAFAREYFGTDYVDYYVEHRRHEVEEYRRAVTNWEVRRYVSSI